MAWPPERLSAVGSSGFPVLRGGRRALALSRFCPRLPALEGAVLHPASSAAARSPRKHPFPSGGGGETKNFQRAVLRRIAGWLLIQSLRFEESALNLKAPVAAFSSAGAVPARSSCWFNTRVLGGDSALLLPLLSFHPVLVQGRSADSRRSQNETGEAALPHVPFLAFCTTNARLCGMITAHCKLTWGTET